MIKKSQGRESPQEKGEKDKDEKKKKTCTRGYPFTFHSENSLDWGIKNKGFVCACARVCTRARLGSSKLVGLGEQRGKAPLGKERSTETIIYFILLLRIMDWGPKTFPLHQPRSVTANVPLGFKIFKRIDNLHKEASTTYTSTREKKKKVAGRLL